ncbi:hypothetical protein X798_07881 [Onchocerca flexuosa]|uniref:Uncharacterized protein n=1 Tax=Onchocerca flexuosa TaxID=387005 RepID=A0A238BJC6_9BILA|nr:hypothetical protein X798_07881 [Onchocerca flexuosa]
MAQSAEKDKEDKQTDGWMDCLIADSLINVPFISRVLSRYRSFCILGGMNGW